MVTVGAQSSLPQDTPQWLLDYFELRLETAGGEKNDIYKNLTSLSLLDSGK